MADLLGLLESELNFLKNLTLSQSPANSCHFLNFKDSLLYGCRACIKLTISNAYQNTKPVRKTNLQMSKKNHCSNRVVCTIKLFHSRGWPPVSKPKIPIISRCINMPWAKNLPKEPAPLPVIALHLIRVIKLYEC